MREATGELNSTLIVVMAIAALAAFFFMWIWPVYRENYMRDVISICRENDIPYCVWNYLSTPNDGNRFSLVDDDTRKILSERLGKILIGEE